MRATNALAVLSLAILAATTPLAAQVPAGAPQPTKTADAAGIAASLTMQLRNLVSAQEAYYADHDTYSNSLKALGYVAREGAHVTVFRADRRGWAGRAVHPDLAGKSCVIWVGPSGEAAKPRTDATQMTGREGEPVCDAP